MDFRAKYSGLIFDCDGTLTDSMPLHFVAWQKALQEFSVHFPEDKFYSMAGIPSRKIIAQLSQEQSVPLDIDIVSQTKENHFLGCIDQLQPIEVVCQVARDHFGLIPMAVASGGTRTGIHSQLAQLKLSEYFSVVVTAEDTTRHKPEPDVFIEAAKRLGVEPGLCCVFEDSPLGFTAARLAGMDCIDIRDWTFHPATY
jgi:beta-phosphoglucomutase-like phosphatase (HAD superfamily)